MHAAAIEWVARFAGHVGRFRGYVRQELQMARGLTEFQPLEVAKAVRAAGFVLAPEGPLLELVTSMDEAPQLQAPRLYGSVAEAQLIERDAHFGAPAFVVDAGRGLPDGIPPGIATGDADA